jgi:hypothetical protein
MMPFALRTKSAALGNLTMSLLKHFLTPLLGPAGWCWAVAVAAYLTGVSIANDPVSSIDMGETVEEPSSARVVPGMSRDAVERLLKEEPAWESVWSASGGQYWTHYPRAGLRVYYDPDSVVYGKGRRMTSRRAGDESCTLRAAS